MSSSLVSLLALRAFMVVASTGNVRKGAGLIFRAPSAVTRLTKMLERSLDVVLFERKAGGMLLTAPGKVLMRRVQQVNRELDLAWISIVERGAGVSLNAAAGFQHWHEKRLQIYVDLHDVHHMPTVARMGNISQPAVSQAIRALETSLGVRLFERSAQGFYPVAGTAQFALHIKRALAELRVVEPELAALGGTIKGNVVVGALPLGRTALLPEAIARVVMQYPQLRIRTMESPYEALATGLRSGEIDFIVGALRSNGRSDDFVEKPLFVDELMILAGAHHPLAKKKALSISDLLDARWIMSRPGSPTRELVEAEFSRHSSCMPLPIVETGDLAILRGLLLRGDMVTATSSHQLSYEIDNGSLRILPFDLKNTAREIGITQRLGAEPSPGARLLIEAVTEISSAPPFSSP